MTPPPVISGNTTTKKDDSIAQGFQLYRAAVSEQAQDDEIHENEVYQEGKPSLEIISDPEEKYEEYSYNNEELGNFDQKIPSEEPLLDEELISVTDPQQKSDDLHDASSLIHNHYALKQTIKVGGMGRIILARDNIMERLVAIKEIRPELLKEYKNAEMYRKRLILEAKITGYLDHPGIVPVYSLDTDKNGNPFYVMRCIRGITFEEAIKNFHVQGTIQMMRDLLRRFIEICQIIAYAHDLGVIHRDIKPVNLMLGNFGATFVMDWGLAKKIQVNSNDLEMEEESNKIFSFGGDDMRLTQLGAVVGTRWYRSPEYLRTQQNTVQNDIYALGVTLYKFLTNKLPYYHDTMRENTVFTLQTPKPPHELNKLVDKVLAAICMKAISQDCDIRYSSAMNFADDIQRWLENQPVTAYEYSFWERFCHKFQRN